ncbi:MAG: PD-(D/E)XK nuclease family protein, partial [Ignavibacteria bacterium]|nr:PD-(D/E)XK nuclease family protein [Ignavibacteria bacterium]
MKSFIAQIAEIIYKNHGTDLNRVLVVFPSRRAGYYFRRELSALIDKPVWSPAVISINEFISKYSEFETADYLTLLFELYDAYSEFLPEETYDSFYTWGDMLLRDYDAVDKYNVDASKLFKVIKDEKEIEAAFPLEVHQQLMEFWNGVFKAEPDNEYRNKFIEIWSKLLNVYNEFKKQLDSKGIAYEGMSVKNVSDNISNINFEYKKIYFAGFNSLNKCEENIMSFLVRSGKAEIFFDSDSYFTDEQGRSLASPGTLAGDKRLNQQEAGKFLRKNFKTFGPGLIPPADSLAFEPKNITVTGAPLTAGMVKAFGNELKKFVSSGGFVPEKTVVVLPDENTLLPVLYSLADEIKDINVSIGLPFRATPFYNFISRLRKLQNGKKPEKGKFRFYHKDFTGILLHPYVKYISAENTFEILNRVRSENIVYVDPGELIKSDIFNDFGLVHEIFTPVTTVPGLIDWLEKITNLLAERLEKGMEDKYKLFQLEYLYTFTTNLNRLKDVITERSVDMDSGSFWSLLMQLLDTSRINFTGEPLKGMQIMGLLETRNLDFDNVFILSLNEGSLPQGSASSSYIPYNLRKAFGMPTFEDTDAITSYYFYGLLQKAKNIFLFYNTQTGNEVKERSRYVYQIENELAKTNPKVNYVRKIVSFPASFSAPKKIEVKKDDELIDYMKKKIDRLAPSYLINYIECKLKFYLKKVAGLEAGEEVEEVFDAKTLGTFFHDLAEKIYTPYVGKTIDAEAINDMKSLLKEFFDSDFETILKGKKEYKHADLVSIGRNALYKSVILKLINRLLDAELNREKFRIHGLEDWHNAYIDFNISGSPHNIKVFGKVDRIDQDKSGYTVIDYKTGASDMKSYTTLAFDKMFEDSGYRANFQTFFYAYLMYKEMNTTDLKAGIYAMKDARKEGLKLMKPSVFTIDEFKLFEEKLILLLEEIFGKETPFTQTEDESVCAWCDF